MKTVVSEVLNSSKVTISQEAIRCDVTKGRGGKIPRINWKFLNLLFTIVTSIHEDSDSNRRTPIYSGLEID